MSGHWLFHALRTLRRRWRRNAITGGAVALGVALLCLLGSIMVGTSDAMIASSVALRAGHLQLLNLPVTGFPAAWADRTWPDFVRTALPRLELPAFLTTLDETRGAAVQLQGVLPRREADVAAAARSLAAGEYLPPADAAPQVVLGQAVAETLGVRPGDLIRVHFADRSSRRLRVGGVFRTGVDYLDAHLAQAELRQLAELQPPGPAASVALFLAPGFPPDEARRKLKPLCPPGGRLVTWAEYLPELRQLTDLNEVAMLIVIALVVALLAAGVANAMLISVMDRYREFGIMKALGASPAEIFALIGLETGLLCLLAGGAGLALGWGLTLLTARTGIDLTAYVSANPHFVLGGVIHPRAEARLLLLPVGAVLLLGGGAALYPAGIAARARAADILRS